MLLIFYNLKFLLIKLLRKTQLVQHSKGFIKMIFLEIEIPLPSFEEQTIIIAEIEKQRAIIEGADKVLCNWKYKNLISFEKV